MDVRRGITLCAAAFAALAVAGCGSADKPASAPASAAAGAIEVTLGKPDELMLTLSATEAKAGKVTFHVTNLGTTEHEMVVVPLALGATPAVLADPSTGEAKEDASLGEVGSTPAGKSGDVTLDLAPGRYALLCNEPGHFSGGMYTTLTVS